jgi:predicted NBD/HSP70 family sugar kinase
VLEFFQNISLDALNRVEKKKYHTKQRIINSLFLYNECDCNCLARLIHLSVPSTQTSINELIKDGIVEEKGHGTSSGGRRPVLYGLVGGLFYILSMDVGRFHVRLSLLDSNLQLHEGIETHEIRFQDSPEYLDNICELAIRRMESSGFKKELFIGIGLSMPGAIDSLKGINYSYFYNQNETLSDALGKRFHLPVFLENDTNVLALAEMWYGQARNKRNALVLLLSWGIGLGLILNGKLYRGASGYAGEFSHIPAVNNGQLCWCNKQGCLETVASATALSTLVKEGIRDGKSSLIFETADISKEYIEPQIVITAATQGDQFAVNILYEVGHQLGKGIASLIQILNPEIIILGGKMAEAGQYIITPIQQALNSYCNPVLTKDLSIVSTEFREEATALGLAIMVSEKLLSNGEHIR